MDSYQRVARAIRFLDKNFAEQPDLEKLAKSVGLSPFHLQRLFTKWAGVSPKKFLQFTTIEFAKCLLREEKSLLDTSLQTGLSGSGRLHDLFIKIEGMTPGEFKNQGANLSIEYSFAHTHFGEVLVASTQKGITHLSFSENKKLSLGKLRNEFPRANFVAKKNRWHKGAIDWMIPNTSSPSLIHLHVKGTPFQLKVWQALLKIPEGSLCPYASVATEIGKPKASRAVGSAIAYNSVAYLIPCHRVIKSTGGFGQYRWGAERKRLMIGWEVAHVRS